MKYLNNLENVESLGALAEDNAELTEQRLWFCPPSKMGGVTTTIVGPPNTGSWEVDELWWDVNCAKWRCTVAGTPGTWQQAEPAVATSFPGVAPDNYWLVRPDLDWQQYRFDAATSGWLQISGGGGGGGGGSVEFATLALTSGAETLESPSGQRNVTLASGNRMQVINLNGGTAGQQLRLYVKWLASAIELSIKDAASVTEIFNYRAATGSEALLEFIFDGTAWLAAAPNFVATPSDAPSIEPVEPAIDTSFISANALLWLRGSKLARSGTLDGDPILSWPDESSFNSPAIQANGTRQPKLKLASINGYSSVIFDGVDDYLTHGSLFSGTGARTVCVVYKTHAAPNNVNSICGQSGATGTGKWFVIQSRNWSGAVGDPYFAGYSADLTDSVAPTNATAKLAVISYNGTNVTIRKNGVQTASAAKTLNTNTTAFLMGADDTSGTIGEFLKGEIAEVIVFGSAVTGTNLTAVENYLMTKYNLK